MLAQAGVREVGRELDPQYGGEIVPVLEDPPDREGLAGEPRRVQNRSTASGSYFGRPRRNQRPNVERVASLSMMKIAPPRRTTRSSSERPGSQPGPKK